MSPAARKCRSDRSRVPCYIALKIEPVFLDFLSDSLYGSRTPATPGEFWVLDAAVSPGLAASAFTVTGHLCLQMPRDIPTLTGVEAIILDFIRLVVTLSKLILPSAALAGNVASDLEGWIQRQTLSTIIRAAPISSAAQLVLLSPAMDSHRPSDPTYGHQSTPADLPIRPDGTAPQARSHTAP